MLTVKSILTGALVLGAASVPAGVVVSDLASDSVPAAPRAIAVATPVLASTGTVFVDVYVSDVRLPPAPARITGVEEPRVETPDLELEDSFIGRDSFVPRVDLGFDRT